MTSIQKFFTTILPRAWAEDMQAESERWMMRCECGFERSIWEWGGIRWKGRGEPRRLMRCSSCGKRTWHKLYQKQA